jgi:hypothetical protein
LEGVECSADPGANAVTCLADRAPNLQNGLCGTAAFTLPSDQSRLRFDPADPMR